MDFVNVLVPAHYLVLYSRLGGFDTARLHDAIYERGHFLEQWAHEASIVPARLWPHLEYRRRRYRPYPNSPIMKLKGKSRYLSEIYEIIKENGEVTSGDLPPVSGPARRQGDWHRSVPRWALECHFGAGKLAVVRRLPNFQRVYDLPERVVAEQHLAQRVPEQDARRELIRIAASALGVATASDLADYYRMSGREARPGIDELVEEGALTPVSVESWQEPAYLASTASVPRRVDCASLLSPFDPLVWFRPRALRLFDFHYRIEIYVPAAKRKFGYYVLPFLMNDRIAARVDLKADRQNCRLLVQASHLEAGADPDETATKLTHELAELAHWLGLDDIRVARRGSFAHRLAMEVRSTI